MRKRVCPNCQADLPVNGASVKFDSDDNVLCSLCGKPIIATTSRAEAQVAAKNAPPSTITTAISHRPNWQHQTYTGPAGQAGAGVVGGKPISPPKKPHTQTPTTSTEPWRGAGVGFAYGQGDNPHIHSPGGAVV